MGGIRIVGGPTMLVAPAPLHEAERLADLQALKILDTPPEHRFERLVDLACTMFEVPIAYLALVDSDRQWFKARRGIPARQTGRSVSICSHTILTDDMLVIPDTTLDERFADNPLVTREPFIRFYAGHPLCGPGGYNVGTFCVADYQPRFLGSRDRQMFKKLAAVAEHEMKLSDLARTQRQLLKTKNELLQSQQQLKAELSEAARYVYSMLPAPLFSPVATDWTFISSSQLGGDLFGYHWRDQGQLIVYLLDVSGHGIGASLLSITMAHMLRSETLPDVDFNQPAQVINALNRSFQMKDNCRKFVTMWYGVFNRDTRNLRYACAGHHPAIVFQANVPQPEHLGSRDLPIGVDVDHEYNEKSITLPRDARMYLFSDGVFDIERAAGGMMTRQELVELIAEAQRHPAARVQHILERICADQGSTVFKDDYSLLELSFQ